MNAITMIFIVIMSAIALTSTYNLVLPALTGTQANAATASIQGLGAILKDAERQGISTTNRADRDDIAYLLTGWTAGGTAVNAAGTGDLLDSPAGQDSIKLMDEAPRGGFAVLIEDTDTCTRVFNQISRQDNPQFIVHPSSCDTGATAAPAPYGTTWTATILDGQFTQDATAVRTIGIIMR